MDITLKPRPLRGEVTVIPSKSHAHRLLICAAFADKPTLLRCDDTNRDIEATADCLRALGAEISRTESGYTVLPAREAPETAVLNCRESGSTLRFMLPIVGALGVDATFHMEGRLPKRPLSPLWEEMERMGCTLSRPTETTIRCQGKLKRGKYSIDGGVSSQFTTGLLFAHSLMDGCTLEITGKLESKPYVDLTKAALSLFENRRSPGYVAVEGDWSNGAFWVVAEFLGADIEISGLSDNSLQRDKQVASLLPLPDVVDAKDIPDIVPILCVAASGMNKTTRFIK